MKTDIHHHFIPKALSRYKSELPSWSAGDSIAYLDKNGIERAILSIPELEIDFSAPEEYVSFCREVNRELSRIIEEYPEKFGGFGLLPFPYIEECLAELDFCRTYGFEGIILFTNVNGVYPSAVEHGKLFSAFNSGSERLFIHPAATPPINGKHYPGVNYSIEYPQEVTRLLSMLLVEDSFEKYPDIRYILGHGGGLFPFQFSRIGKLPYTKIVKGILRIRWNRVLKDMVTKKILIVEYLRNIELDTFDTRDPAQKAAIKEYFKPEQCLYGSNFPCG